MTKYGLGVGVDVIVLNGGSSSGKSSIARRIQQQLGPSWLILGVDDLIRALSGGDVPDGSQPSIHFGLGGSITIGDAFRRAENAWYAGLGAIGRSGAGLIIDEVFLGGGASQERLAASLSGLSVVWVGVRCEADIAEARELVRGDRVLGMARLQADQVHKGVRYDVLIDTSAKTIEDCVSDLLEYLWTSELRSDRES